MASSSRKNAAKLKLFLQIVLVASFLSIGIMYMLNRGAGDQTREVITSSEKKASLALSKINHKATKNGQKQWDLTADKASYFQKENRIIFDKIFVTFFMKNGQKLDLTADKGTLDTETNDIEITGNIVASSENRVMKTETLQYLYKQHIIKSDSPIEINGKDFSISADRMTLNLETELARLDGNVNGNFSEAFTF